MPTARHRRQFLTANIPSHPKMDPEAEPAPQVKSHPDLEPVNGLMLYRREAARRDSLLSKGNLATGCGELDDEVLAGGGFERGCVVGVSAEQEEFGLLVGLQTVARLLVAAQLNAAAATATTTTPAIPLPRAMIITTLDMAALLPTLSGVLEAQAGMLLQLQPVGGEDPAPPAPAVARSCLEQISISRVFDLEGLWEVLQEDLAPEAVPVDAGVSPSPAAAEVIGRVTSGPLTNATSTSQKNPQSELGGVTAEVQSSPPAAETAADGAVERSALPPEQPSIEAKTRRTEIMDSEDEMSLLSSSSSELSPPPASSHSPAAAPVAEQSDVHRPPNKTQEPPSSRSSSLSPPPSSAIPSDVEIASPPLPTPPTLPALPATTVQDDKTAAPRPISATPDIILVTHMSALMTALFRRRDKQSAHAMLELLASHLRHVSRSPEHGCPLVMLLNGTNAPVKVLGEHNQHHHRQDEYGPPPRFEGDPGGNRGSGGNGSQRPLDPTLRSIFNLPHALEPEHSYYGHGGNNDGGGGGAAVTRRNKPVYGLVFTQLLDLHLLATLVPRGPEDAEAALLPRGRGDGRRAARYCWVVEVLLDELGVWRGAGRPRVCREQRWGAVEVWGGGVLVADAF
ncbi:hypothetical protein RB595_010095 [Gaeumannomyces hyphopodioides]